MERYKMYLALVGGRKLTLVNGSARRMPKKSVDLPIVLDGTPYVAKVTSNIAWCGGVAAKALEYIWVEIDGVAKYATLNYGEKAAEFAGVAFERKDGVGDPIPKRVTATAAAKKREAGRVEKFVVTWAKRRDGVTEEVAPEATPEVAETAEA